MPEPLLSNISFRLYDGHLKNDAFAGLNLVNGDSRFTGNRLKLNRPRTIRVNVSRGSRRRKAHSQRVAGVVLLHLVEYPVFQLGKAGKGFRFIFPPEGVQVSF